MKVKNKACEEQEVSLQTLCDEELREIYLTGVVDANMYQNIAAAIRHLDQTKGEINLIINTPGGSAEHGFAISEFIRSTRNLVIGHCVGECMSIGMAILAACDGRVAYPSTRFMVHEVHYSGLNGDMIPIKTLQRYLEECQEATNKYNKMLVEGSSLTLEEVKALCANDTFFSTEQALGYGFIDGMYEDAIPKRSTKKIKSTKKGKKNAKS